jgi:hypothetical protein
MWNQAWKIANLNSHDVAFSPSFYYSLFFWHAFSIAVLINIKNIMSFQLSSSEKTSSLLSNVLGLYMSDTNSIHQNLTFILDILLNHRLLCNKDDSITDDLSIVYKKWTVRLNTLLQSKTLAARWSGITLVRVTCEQSPSLLIANAKTWTAQLLGFLAVSINIKCISIQLVDKRCIFHRKQNPLLFTKRPSKHYAIYSLTPQISPSYKEKLPTPTCKDITNCCFRLDVIRCFW